jgi:TonB family protein
MVGLLSCALVQWSPMKLIVSFVGIFLVSSLAYSQSGRRTREIKVPVSPPAQETAERNTESRPNPSDDRAAAITAERNQDYRCTDDGTLERILETGEGAAGNVTKIAGERILTSKETDSPVVITTRPQPSYTKEGRRNGIQGFVALKVLLSGNGKVTRLRVLKGLPAGLTESAIRAACKIKFKPAVKDNAPVSQWVVAEYAFRLADSSIFRP